MKQFATESYDLYRPSKREVIFLVSLIAICLLILVFGFQFHLSIEGDGVHYASLARNIVQDGLVEGLLKPYRASLYPYFIAGMTMILEDIHLSGMVVSAVFGALLIVPVYLLAADLFSPRVGWITVLFVLSHQVLIDFSAMLFTESTFIFFAYAGFFLVWLVLRGKLFYAPFAGGTLGIAALIHPQGIGYVAIPIMISIVALLSKKRPYLGRGWGASILGLLLAFGMVISAFYLPVWLLTGETPLSSKIGINIIGGEDIDARDPQRTLQRTRALDETGENMAIVSQSEGVSMLEFLVSHPYEVGSRVYRNLGKLDRDVFLNALRPSQLSGAQMLFFSLLVLGVIGLPWGNNRVSHLYLLAIVFYNIFSNALFFYHERLLFPIIPVILIWAALGSVRLGRWMKATLGGLGLQLSHRSFVQLGWALLIILSLLFVANDFRLAGQSYAITALYEKEMGIALRSYVPQDARIMADNPFIPYYFFEDQQDYRFVPYAEPDALISYAIANEVEYIIITDWMTTDLGFPIAELFESSLPEDLKLIHEWMFDSGHRARLFNLELEEFMGE